MSSNDIVVLTSYFNPVGYRRRLANYKAFRERLDAPLVTVELLYGETGELTDTDADTLIQIRTDQVLWQKERLLNLALASLPDEPRYVVWLDCDLLFGNPDWLAETAAALEEVPLVQPYSAVYDLARDADPANPDTADVLYERPSMAALYGAGAIDVNDTRANCMGQHSPGHAWAARRDALAAGFYDTMILGSGDLAMAMAAVGNQESVVEAFEMNQAFARHYRDWAASWHDVVRGRIGVVDGPLYHLWHGDLEDRGYDSRYPSIKEFSFDPAADLAIADNGSWRWKSDKPDLHRTVADYFGSRKEDGE